MSGRIPRSHIHLKAGYLSAERGEEINLQGKHQIDGWMEFRMVGMRSISMLGGIEGYLGGDRVQKLAEV